MHTATALLPLLLLPLLGTRPLAAQVEPQDDPLYQQLEPLGWELTDRYHVPGVSIAVIRGGRLAWHLGCGYADLETEELVTPDTVFNIGSISKTVAAWGVMRLVEEGKLDLDAPVETYLTRWKLPASEFDATKVTMRRLLSHTAGLSLHGYPGFEPGEELPTIEASLSGATGGAGDVHLISEPGTSWKYSGGGYTMAQLALEELTGMGFAEYMRERVLMPLGMSSSDYRWTPEIDARAATPYDELARPIGGPRFTAQAAASLQTSAADLARFLIAGMPAFATADSPHLLKPETVAEMHTAQPAAGGGYGLGHTVEDKQGTRSVGHGGANRGWMAQIMLVPASGDGLIVMTNGSNGNRLIAPILSAWTESLGAPATEEASAGR